MKTFVVLGINLFRNIKLNIAFFYISTTSGFIYLFYYLHSLLELNVVSVFVLLAALTTLSGYMIAKLATQPLIRYIEHLQNISSQTLHELNLPVATILTNLSMLKKQSFDAKNLQRLQRIESATAMLQERYNELDYLIKKQTLKKIVESFYVDELVEKRVEILHQLYPSHHFRLELERVMLKNDPTGLAKTIDNLIENSVKYSPKNSTITIKFTKNCLSIQDEGRGIESVELVRIFDSFYQEDSSAKGFGIGLFMVKNFCDANNIELFVDSKVGKGTTVRLTFKG